jgi:DNA-binding PadR family transcriptional regulator
MGEGGNSLTDVDRVIHEPARLIIITILSALQEADFLYLLNETELTKGNLSSHLSKLEQVGYVEIEKTFIGKTPRTICRLTEEGLQAFTRYQQQINEILGKAKKGQ